MKTLRIICTVISALCLAAAMPLGTFFDWLWALPCLLGAGIFFMLMTLFKGAQERKEEKEMPTPKQGDFFSPLEKDENEKNS